MSARDRLDRPAVRVGAFAVGLLAVFALALGAGSLWGPTVAAPDSDDEAMAHGGMAEDEPAGHDEGGHVPGGLMRSQDGYSLDLASATADRGRDVPLALTISGPDGHVLDTEAGYAVEHDKRLHLIVVRRDLTGFQHVHPELGDDGRWTTAVDLAPGTWRVFADFTAADGPALTLGTDLTVPGRVPDVQPVGDDASTSSVDGYDVTLDGELEGGAASDLTLTVTRGGRPVTDLQPYLGAFGHLVALREGDLAYLHVHPHEEAHAGDRGGPAIDFTAEVPSAGRYRLFLDFKAGGVVRTATFDLAAGGDRGHD
ncbi:hypothetical protein [Nocardioides iriomotensis]|uniref:hypothetical protein n=1 Tax=Nocardioides iriomotensis TaxID=715784 RepID=UPI00197D580F|nr:hypothetical protein [Nocardioides iriomotensis]